MKVIFTIVLLLMTIGLTACGILLWRRRKETGDYSRHIQAIFSWLSALTTFVFIFRTWNESLVVDATLFEPEHTFVPLLMQMTFFLYPLEVIRPSDAGQENGNQRVRQGTGLVNIDFSSNSIQWAEEQQCFSAFALPAQCITNHRHAACHHIFRATPTQKDRSFIKKHSNAFIF